MKKVLVIMLSLVMALTMFTACGQKEEVTKTDKVIAGMLPTLGASEEELTQAIINGGAPSDVVVQYFDDLNSLIMALQGEKINHIGRIPEPTAQYIENNHADIKAYYDQINGEDQIIKLYMGFNNDKKELADKVEVALNEMKNDGTIDKLSADYIVAFVEGEEPAAVEMPVIDGAETIKMAVTGDLPPFDYASADGKPCGFNTAMLAELSKRIGMNIELICTNSAGRAAALSSGKADGLFYVSQWSAGDNISDSDCPDSIISVGPFYESKSYIMIRAE